LPQLAGTFLTVPVFDIDLPDRFEGAGFLEQRVDLPADFQRLDVMSAGFSRNGHDLAEIVVHFGLAEAVAQPLVQRQRLGQGGLGLLDVADPPATLGNVPLGHALKRSAVELAAESGSGEPAQCPAVDLAEREHRVVEGDDQAVTDLAGLRELRSQVGAALGGLSAPTRCTLRRRNRSMNRRSAAGRLEVAGGRRPRRSR